MIQGTVSAAAGGAYQVTATASDGPNTATVNFVWQVGRLRWVAPPGDRADLRTANDGNG